MWNTCGNHVVNRSDRQVGTCRAPVEQVWEHTHTQPQNTHRQHVTTPCLTCRPTVGQPLKTNEDNENE